LAGAPAVAAVALAAGTAANTLAIAVARQSDETFELIEAHKAAVAAYSAECEADEGFFSEDLMVAAMDAELDAREDLLICQPTTVAGVAALLEHLGRPEWLGTGTGEHDDESVLSGAIAMDGALKAAALQMPGILASALRSIIASPFLGDAFETP
jgi:hypothetical protein